MQRVIIKFMLAVLCLGFFIQFLDAADRGIRERATFKRLKAHIDSVPAIDTHNHLWPFETLPGYYETAKGHGMTLASLWRNSYFSWVNRIPPWDKAEPFADWWRRVQPAFGNALALFPQLKEHLWKHKGKLTPPEK